MKSIKWIFIPLLLISSAVLADSFPIKEHIFSISPNGRYILDVHIFKDEKYVKGILKKVDGGALSTFSEVILEGAKFPKFATVSDGGVVSTVDENFGRGVDRAIVIYRADGGILKKYSISDLYSEVIVEGIRESTSGRIWHCADDAPIVRKEILAVQDSMGGTFEVDLISGEWKYFPGTTRGQCREVSH